MRNPSIVLLGAAALAACGDDAALPADAAPPPDRVLFLVFEGVSLVNGADDSPPDNSSIVLSQPFDAPPYLDGVAGRDQTIATAVAAVRAVLAPYRIEVVTERPADEGYEMLVIGGLSEDAGFPAGVGAIMPFACGETDRNVGLIFGGITDPEDLAYTVVASLGVINQIPFSDVPGDCMCWADAGCVFDGEMCTIGGAGTTVDADTWSCETITEMDEHARFVAELGER